MLLARNLFEDIRAERLTPRDVLELCAVAIAEQEADVHAFAALDLDRARTAAEAPGLARTPLAGLPVGIKDVIDTADLPTAYGTEAFAGNQPRTDAAVVRQVKRAGGIIPGKTVTTELAFLRPSITKNPRRLTHTPGGSSAGSAAAVAAGMLPLALGTQTGGSVLRPASFCGVTGYKPTFRLIPTVGMKVFSWHLDTIGLFGARVADVAYGAAAITGRDLDLADADIGPARFAVVRTARAHLADAASHAALDSAIAALAKAGADVREIALPEEIEAADAIHPVIQDYEGWHALADEYDNGLLSPLLRGHLEAAAAITPDAYDEARRTAKRARQRLGDLFADCDALLTFAAPGEAPEGFATTGSAMFNRLWTLMGTPCVSVPGLLGPSGLPVGVQVVGRFGRDRRTLAAAAFLERALAAR
ncbi:malonamidase E2 [Azorhizobium caulinodans ORS 571]|uniref:Malonamidase E2 n=1 Tax=Azorhizobium caulinodans (strain ATCC 43989 / DSM 5975 / JCM 20966 / LMG 6465 / NBRC 14845 / NCIMB 13405 / ORS 571) TaxID=438753 RepID=A8HQS6_AZOC5|nr:amidase [Azorhizobium caulinodans]BAF87057.1 malonamidase E2 [Azorhizobium caulinodans ORS 571]